MHLIKSDKFSFVMTKEIDLLRNYNKLTRQDHTNKISFYHGLE